MVPKRRASLKRTTVPSSSVSTTWSWRAAGNSAPPAVIRPDMPRCSSSNPSPSSSIRMYLPRRCSAPIWAPSRRRASAGGNGRRRSARFNCARTMVRPLIFSARPRRTVSTSGSSGMRGGPFDEVRGIVGARGGAALSSCPMIADETSGETAAAADGPAPHDKARLVRAVFDSVAPRYDLMNDLMSGGIHRLWKREMIALLNPRPNQRLVDVAGGTGDVALGAWRHMARLGPVAGEGGVLVCDVNERMLAIGRARALDEGILAGIEWLCADAEALPFGAGSADLYTIAFGLRNVTRLDR